MVVEGYVAGMHQSPYHGFSVEFAEHREYVPGRRHPPPRLEGLVEDRQVLPQAVRGGDEPPRATCCSTPASRWPTPRATNVSQARVRRSASPRRWRYLVLQQQDSVGLATFDDAVRRYLQAGGPAVAPEAAARTLMDVTPAGAEVGPRRRSSTTWPSGSRSAAWWSSSATCSTTSRRILAGPEALPPPPARGDRLPRARPGRARFPLPRHDAVQGAGRDCPTSSPSRTPCAGPIRPSSARSWPR